ncbi:hypothetical protein [Methyloglobulus morosus]|nr:hypothetical protein [Methyloglobulus morosus]
MKKKLLVLLFPLLLVACADKQQYEEVVLEEMKKEQDVKDYKIDPAYMAKCVIDTTYQRMPGFFAFDPDRLQAYRNYSKMLKMSLAQDPQKTLEELRKDFGSPQELAKAHSVYTESIMDCYTAILHEKDPEDQAKTPG